MVSRGQYVAPKGLLHNGASIQLWNLIDALRSERDNNKRSRLAQGAYQLIVDLDRAAQASVVLLAETEGQTNLIESLTNLCNEQSDVLQSIAEGKLVVARDVVGEDEPITLGHLKED